MTKPNRQPVVLITDYAWPDITVETDILEAAGLHVVAGPADPAPAEVIEDLMQEYQPDAVLFCWAPVTEKAIASAPDLKIAARLGVGLDNLAVDACTERGIWVTNVPDYCVEEVSDHAVAMLLAWARGLLPFDRQIREGTWNPASAQLRRVADLTVGIIGYGRIGKRTAGKLAAFGVRLLACDPTSRTREVELCDINELAERSDVLIVHAPLKASTHHLISRQVLQHTKPGALLINVSRGGVVDTDAVIDALHSGALSAAALDVLEHEPQVPAALREHPHVILTPHVAFSSDASVIELRRRASEEVVRVLQGLSPLEARNSPVLER